MPPDSLVRGVDALEIFLQNGFHGRMRQD